MAASSDEALRSLVAEVGAWEDDEAAVSPPAPAAAITRPYYECVFCKRGFTTAQALGGHMNIHRRDRGKSGRDRSRAGSITPVSRNIDCYNQYRHSVHHPAPPPATPMRSILAMQYAGAATAAAGQDAEAVSAGRPRELSLFQDHDLHLGLGCYGRTCHASRAPEGSEWHDGGEPERKLDLELRLGRLPWH